jgi:hypothetical protein
VCLSTGREHNLSRLSSRGVPVVLTTLDAVVGEQPVSGVKIDVEGFELQVLEGAEGVLGQKPWVVVEFNTILTGEKELSDWDVHGFLTERGYKPASVSDPGSLLPDDSEVFGYLNLLYRSRADWMP